ncbi:Response regulator protein TodT [Paraburkholderia caffeinitolerans]|uniref:Response regulator protein TodT n=1 Tax=Paraburkholderia caffeinitolerans TaxID=1723730 RepID=A0A6J5G0U6_9BURK|nr:MULTISPECIES: response regulator [Paraburkholderia]CAB3787858.1 Response regulator protein TodT [Paraburkholderia caffeinitolerans]
MSESGKATIHVVEDDEGLRDALAVQLRCAGYVVRTYASAGEFLVSPPPTGNSCALIDLVLPGPGGLSLQQALLRDGDTLPIVFMSGHNDVASAVKAMKAGAVDFLVKPFGIDVLVGALEAALSSRANQASAPRTPSIELSERERFVLTAIVGGSKNKDIARELRLSERTIKHCRAALMQRFEATSFADLLRRAAPMVEEAL